MLESDHSRKVPAISKPDLLLDATSNVPDGLQGLVSEAWQRADLSEARELRDHLGVVVNMDRVIGQTTVVKTRPIKPDDDTLFSRKRNRRYVSRVVKAKVLPDSRYLSLICDRREQRWRLRRIEIGAFVAPEPMDFSAILRQGATLPSVVHYWLRHAHVYRAENFSTSAHEDTWTRVLSKAQLNHRPEVLRRVGYFEFAADHNIAIDLPNQRD
jgi:hypothetical protein